MSKLAANPSFHPLSCWDPSGFRFILASTRGFQSNLSKSFSLWLGVPESYEKLQNAEESFGELTVGSFNPERLLAGDGNLMTSCILVVGSSLNWINVLRPEASHSYVSLQSPGRLLAVLRARFAHWEPELRLSESLKSLK